MSHVLPPYVLYVALYLGVALTGGSVVHLPLDPGRYLLIGAVGVLVFIAASALDARRRHAAAVEGGGGALGGYLDRKSTRLNSSHANISYAVFCLKKKKQ